MLKKLKQQSKGFTIIEVLIVLAIAGLILLIVFLAVPALQRNARNTSRRDDVAKLLGLVTEYASSNNGQLPNTAACNGSSMELSNSGGGTQPVSSEGAYYCNTAGTSLSWVNVDANGTDPDSLELASSRECAGTTGDAQSGPARSVVAMFTLEPDTPQCQAS